MEERTLQWLRENIASSKIRHQFVVVHLQNQTDLVWLADNLDRLPSRVFVYSQNISNLGNLSGQVAQLDDSSSFTFDYLYKAWLRFLHSRRPTSSDIRVILLHDDVEDDTTELLLANPNIFLCRWKCKILNSNCNYNHNVLDRDIIFDKHFNHYVCTWINICLHYEPHSSGDPVRNIVYRDVESLKLLAMQLVESALMKILIIDERIAQSLKRDVIKDNYRGPLCQIFKWKGVYITGEQFSGHDFKVCRKDLFKLVQCDNLQRTTRNPQYDFVLLHQGIIDKLYDKEKGQESRSEFAQKLVQDLKYQGKPWKVVIHSARRRPTLPQGVKFMPLSNVEAWMARNASKYEIIQELLTL